MRAVTTVHATIAALAIRLRLPQSFRENSQQLVGISSIKKRSRMIRQSVSGLAIRSCAL
jgi:hypothetical protein